MMGQNYIIYGWNIDLDFIHDGTYGANRLSLYQPYTTKNN